MNGSSNYLIDSDVLITAKNSYYSFAICPGFWEAILREYQNGKLHSIDPVRDELLSGRKNEDLVEWVRNDLPRGFFHDCSSNDVVMVYSEILSYVQAHPRYKSHVKAAFADGADGWLVAMAKVGDYAVVTNEKSQPESVNSIKIPDLCTYFNLRSIGTFSMLRELAVQFDLSATK